jgi:hypothetical protein
VVNPILKSEGIRKTWRGKTNSLVEESWGLESC